MLQPASSADLPAVLALFRLSDEVEFGSLQLDETELAGPLGADGTEAVLLCEDGEAVGYAHLTASGEAETVADPARPGAQDRLLAWVLDRARSRGTARLEHWAGPRPDSPVSAALQRSGFAHARTVWHLARGTTPDLPPPALPEGAALRPFDRERDGREVHALVQRVFDGAHGSHRRSYEEWSRLVLDAGAGVLAVEQDGVLVAVATHLVRLGDGHVGQLAVEPAQRGRGLALALLHEAFRRDAAAGRPRTTLGVDGENGGALRLYEKAGMHVVQEFRRWERVV